MGLGVAQRFDVEQSGQVRSLRGGIAVEEQLVNASLSVSRIALREHVFEVDQASKVDL